MPLLLDLPSELIEEVLECVAPNDLENFVLSCKVLYESVRHGRLPRHLQHKVYLRRIESDREELTPWHDEFPELLQQFLLVPSMADYVKELVVKHWKVRWDDPGEDAVSDKHRPYPDQVMRAYEDVVKGNNSIPSKEKELWISKVRVGDENPVIALLFPRLHYLTCLRIELGDREDLFMLKALQHIAKDPCSPALSRLREVEIHGTTAPTYRLELAIACAALPSILSLKAYRLVEGPLDLSAENGFELAPRSSSIQHLTIYDCRSSPNALSKLIRSAKSLRSFTCIYIGQDVHLRFAWVYAALLQFASTSLEELTIRHSFLRPGLNKVEYSFKSYQNLRVLTINSTLLMGDKIRATNMIVTLLPASLQILNLIACHVYSSAWFKELVEGIICVKKRAIPCLKELNLKETWKGYQCSAEEVRDLCAAAMEAGVKLHIT